MRYLQGLLSSCNTSWEIALALAFITKERFKEEDWRAETRCVVTLGSISPMAEFIYYARRLINSLDTTDGGDLVSETLISSWPLFFLLVK